MPVAEWLYRAGVGAYHLGIRAAARTGNERARQWIEGRELPVDRAIEALHAAGRPIVWLHAASLGEYEQGRPVLEALRGARPEWAVVVTFFSPSGYERSRSTELAEVVAYLPRDTPRAANAWTALLRPHLAIFVKYEFWYYHLTALRNADVPVFLIAGSFRREQPFFRWYGRWWRELLQGYTHFAVQTTQDRELLAELGLANVTITGDPRIDRTLALAEMPFTDERLARFTHDAPTLIAGSVWPADVEIIRGAWPSLEKNWRLILAPHQLDGQQLRAWQLQFEADRYTDAGGDSRVLILDTIGILSRAYRYGTVAFIGGGFGGSGLHNTLEPMSYGLPTIFGPVHRKFPEARQAISRGGAFSIGSSTALTARLRDLSEPDAYATSRQAQHDYLTANRGAARRTVEVLLRLLFCLLSCLPLNAQSWGPADRMTETLDGVYAKCNLMVAVSGVDWRPGLCMAATELSGGQSVSLRLTLEAGYRYVFIASTSATGVDLDLNLRNQADSILQTDQEADATPVVEYAPDSSDTYILQLHLAGATAENVTVGLGILQSYGRPLPDRSYREVSRQFGAAAGAVRAAGGARVFHNDVNTWSVFGYHLREGEGATIDRMVLRSGSYFFAAAGSDDMQNLDLYLSDNQLNILRSDRDEDAYPMIEYKITEPGAYALRLEAERAREGGLVLLAILSK